MPKKRNSHLNNKVLFVIIEFDSSFPTSKRATLRNLFLFFKTLLSRNMWVKTTAKPDANTGGKRKKWLDETKMLMSPLHNKILSVAVLSIYYIINIININA